MHSERCKSGSARGHAKLSIARSALRACSTQPYIPTWAGFGYLAVVLDVFSRKIVGWAFGQRQTAHLVLSALNMALLTRKPDGVIHHSDQGSQYTSLEFGKRCAQMGVRPSMPVLSLSKGAAWATPTTTRWPRASSQAWSAS